MEEAPECGRENEGVKVPVPGSEEKDFNNGETTTARVGSGSEEIDDETGQKNELISNDSFGFITENSTENPTADDIGRHHQQQAFHGQHDATESFRDNSVNENQENERGAIKLEDNVYRLIFACGYSVATFFSILVIFIQACTIGLISWDTFRATSRPGGSSNPLDFPINVELQVRIAQFVALPLAVMVHRDCTTAVYLLQASYDDERVKADLPHASRTTWYLSLGLRFFIGFALVVVTMSLILSSDRILSMFLNLAALAFIGEIDEFSFYLASKGFLKKELQEACELTDNINLHSRRGEGRVIKQRLLLFFTWVILVVVWIVVIWQQENGYYLQAAACSSFSVKFGTQTYPVQTSNIDLSGSIRNYTYSNLFDIETNRPREELIMVPFAFFAGTYKIGDLRRGTLLADGRAVYYEDVLNNPEKQDDKSVGKFRFCSDGKNGGNWIFKIDALAEASHPQPIKDDCSNWLLRSPPTTSFLLEEVFGGWQIWTGHVEDAQGFSIDCDDCVVDFDCSPNGRCESKTCVCDPGAFGKSCVSEICEIWSLAGVGSKSSDYLSFGNYAILTEDAFDANKSRSAERNLSYERPVFVFSLDTIDLSQFNDEQYMKQLGLLMVTYQGDRWTFWQTDLFSIKSRMFSKTPFHSFWDYSANATLFAFSEPTSSNTPNVPQWNFVVESDGIGFSGTTLRFDFLFTCLSIGCEERCGNFGICNTTTNHCKCTECFGGPSCQYLPGDQYTEDEIEKALDYQAGLPTDYEPTEYYNLFWRDQNLTACSGG